MSDFARPRIRWSLAEKIDELRGRVPRDRYISDVLEAHVEQATAGPATAGEGDAPRSSPARPARLDLATDPTATAEPGGQAESSGEGRSPRSKPVGAGSTPARPASRPGKPFRPAPKGGK